MVAVFDVAMVLWLFESSVFDFDFIQYLCEFFCWEKNCDRQNKEE